MPKLPGLKATDRLLARMTRLERTMRSLEAAVRPSPPPAVIRNDASDSRPWTPRRSARAQEERR
jgi:hypothetical protein